jgi:CheY-like chemotaxis protein
VTTPVTASRQSLQGLPVLVVDDNAINRQYLQGVLTSWGMKPAVVGSAATALAALEASRLRAEPFRLVLLDARMPDEDGFSVAERMRDDPSCADVSIILLASDLGAGDLRRCRELGISRHLVKPITPSELFNAVVEAVGAGSSPATAAPTEVKSGSAPRRSLRVLVAEDNRVNQLVISRMLEQLSHTVVLCADGQEAVAAAHDQHPDLVLMDVQMPVMDGFAATAAIRRREAEEPTRPRIPIVALTAFAVKGDRERCLAAGMDDYLSKPIQRDKLAAVLARLGESDVPTATSDPPYDLSTAISGVEGDRELLVELLAIFAEDGPGQLRAVRDAVSRSDEAALAFAAHTLKGSLRALGAGKAAALAERLEQLGREGGFGGAPGLLAALESEIEQVLVVAAEARRDPGTPPLKA